MRVFNGYIYIGKKQFPQYLMFRCGMTHLNYSSKKLGKTFKLQNQILKTQKNHDEIHKKKWRDAKDEWVDYVRTDVFLYCLQLG